jgi:hypothetical protein
MTDGALTTSEADKNRAPTRRVGRRRGIPAALVRQYRMSRSGGLRHPGAARRSLLLNMNVQGHELPGCLDGRLKECLEFQ